MQCAAQRVRDDHGIRVMCQTSQDVLDCIIAFITEAVVAREILGDLGEPTSPLRLLPARGPPLWP